MGDSNACWIWPPSGKGGKKVCQIGENHEIYPRTRSFVAARISAISGIWNSAMNKRPNDICPPKPIKASKAKNPALTGIRGLAACWVVVFHAYEALQSVSLVPPREGIPIVRSGYLGVDLFFLLSGFILSLTYSKSMSRLGWRGTASFGIGRLFRILPLHWLVLAVLAVATTGAPNQYWGPGPFTLNAFLASAALVQGWIGLPIAWNAPTWSLSAEWLSYVFFVALTPFAVRVKTAALAGLTYCLCLLPLFAALFLFHSSTLDHAERLGLVRCVCEFSAGVMFNRWVQSSPSVHAHGTLLFWAGTITLAVGVLFQQLELAAIFGFSCLIVSSAVAAAPAQIIMGNRLVLFLGEISYSVYLTHLTVINLALALARTSWGQAGGSAGAFLLIAGSTFAVIPLSWLTWRFVEIPFQTVGRRLAARSSRSTAELALGAAGVP